MENIKMTEWKVIKLGDVADIIGGGTPDTKNDSYWGGDVPWLTPKDLSGYGSRYILKGERSISYQGLENSSAKMLPTGSVLLTSRAPIGYVAIAKTPLCTNQGFKSFVLKENADSEFFYYLLKNNVDYIQGMSSGSTFAEISGSQVKALEFKIPPLDVQKRIAGILGALDDRIDVLRRENVVLEQMAQAVFQSWFVDFDIVRAKAAGTPESEVCEKYHITPELYALFPSALTPDNLPLGWEKKAVKDVLTLNYGKALKETDRISGNIPVYGANGQIGTHNKSLVSGPGIVVGRKGTVGTVIWTDYDFYPIDTSFYVTSLFQEQSLHFLHQMLCSVNLPSLSGDSAVPGLNREAAYNQIFICPQEEILKNFENAVTIFYQKRKTNTEQIRALSATRDALLPKLMNGEIEV